jgi:hypothetical protein
MNAAQPALPSAHLTAARSAVCLLKYVLRADLPAAEYERRLAAAEQELARAREEEPTWLANEARGYALVSDQEEGAAA